MDVIIRSKDGKRYRLDTYANATPPSSDQQLHLNKESLTAFFKGAEPVSPNAWQTLWSALNGRPLTSANEKQSPDHIKTQIINLVHRSRIHMLPDGVMPDTKQNTKRPQNKGATSASGSSSSASSSSGSNADSSSTGAEPAAQPSASLTPEKDESQAPIDDKNAVSSTEPTARGEQTSSNTETRACPISMISGEEILELEDATLPGPIPWQFKRIYRSSRTQDIGLGYCWHYSGSEYISLSSNELLYVDQEGREIPFALPKLRQRSKYLPEGYAVDRVSDNTLHLTGDGPWIKVFVRHAKTSSRFVLFEIRHEAYKPQQTLLGVKKTESGYVLRFHYNERAQLVRASGNWGKSLVFRHNNEGRIASIALSNDRTSKSKIVSTYEYDANGDLVAQRNASGIGESYAYINHLFKRRTRKSGFSFHYEWDGTDHNARCIGHKGDNGIYVYRFAWDAEKQRSKVTDSRGFTETFQYNQHGQIVEHIDNEGGLHRYEYDQGQKTHYHNPLGHTTEYLFDRERRPAGVRDALGQRVSFGYFNSQITSITDKDKSFWRREYDINGQLAAIIDPYGQQTRYQYSPSGLIHKVTDPLGRTTTYQWSDAAELIAITDTDGHRRELQYDDWGQCIRSEIVLHNGVSAGAVSFAYTETGQVSQVIAPNGDTSLYQYNEAGQLTQFQDPQGRTTHFKYDGLSQVKERINPAGHSLKYEYDSERNLTALINENGEKYQFFYDGEERLIKEVGFDGRTQHYKYNAAGHLIKHLDAGEVIHDFERDALGRLVKKVSRSLTNKEIPEEICRYQYDPKGRLIETYNANRFLSFAYNAFGNITNEHTCALNDKLQRIQASMEDLQYQNIWPGRRSGITLPDGQTIAYHFDSHNRLSSIDFNNQQLTLIQRDILGRETSREQGDLITISEYDPAGRLSKQQTQSKDRKSDGPISREYAYDPAGNLSRLFENHRETKYTYDLLNRLKSAEGNNVETFEFDPASNLLTVNDQNKGLVKANRLRIQGDRKFHYDARGNLIKEVRGKGGKLQTRYRYNLQNQLVEAEKDGQITRYTYDPLGRRVLKQDAFGATKYLWAADQMVQETRNHIKKTYVYEPENFRPVALVQDDEIYHYHLDQLGTPKEITSQSGRVVWQAQYRTYGNLAHLEVCEIENNLRFQGQYFDEETGLHYNRHRYYNPNSGQFISQDPIGLLGGVNNYQYAPNPTGWVDPLGLSCSETAAEKSASYQGSDPYFGVDPLENIELKKGSILVHITWKSDGGVAGNYFTTVDALESARAKDGIVSSVALNQGLQVYAGDGRTDYKKYVNTFIVTEDIPMGGVATGATKANPQFNPGRYQTHNQYFILDEHLDKLSPAPGKLEIMKDTSAPDISDKLNKLRGEYIEN